MSQFFCSSSVNFLNQLIVKIGDQQLCGDLKTSSIYDDKDIWELAVKSMATIIDELSGIRREFLDSARRDPSHYVWGMEKAVEAQDRYLKHEIINDPKIMDILLKHQIYFCPANSQHDTVKEILEKFPQEIQRQTTEIAKIEKRLKAVEDAAK